jgi:hypothetical protein
MATIELIPRRKCWRALSARDSVLARSFAADDQNDLIISLDCCRTAVHLLEKRQAHRTDRLPEHRDGDSQ